MQSYIIIIEVNRKTYFNVLYELNRAKERKRERERAATATFTSTSNGDNNGWNLHCAWCAYDIFHYFGFQRTAMSMTMKMRRYCVMAFHFSSGLNFVRKGFRKPKNVERPHLFSLIQCAIWRLSKWQHSSMFPFTFTFLFISYDFRFGLVWLIVHSFPLKIASCAHFQLFGWI